jgi:hypothetical protein
MRSSIERRARLAIVLIGLGGTFVATGGDSVRAERPVAHIYDGGDFTVARREEPDPDPRVLGFFMYCVYFVVNLRC